MICCCAWAFFSCSFSLGGRGFAFVRSSVDQMIPGVWLGVDLLTYLVGGWVNGDDGMMGWVFFDVMNGDEYGWMGGWVDGWMGGWVDGWMDGWMVFPGRVWGVDGRHGGLGSDPDCCGVLAHGFASFVCFRFASFKFALAGLAGVWLSLSAFCHGHWQQLGGGASFLLFLAHVASMLIGGRSTLALSPAIEKRLRESRAEWAGDLGN